MKWVSSHMPILTDYQWMQQVWCEEEQQWTLACNTQLVMPASVKMCVRSFLCCEWEMHPIGICIWGLGLNLVLYGTIRRWHFAGGSISLRWALRVCLTGPISCFSLCLLCAMECDHCASWMAEKGHAPAPRPALTWMDWIPSELWAKNKHFVVVVPKVAFLLGCFMTTEKSPVQSGLWRDSHLWRGHFFQGWYIDCKCLPRVFSFFYQTPVF